MAQAWLHHRGAEGAASTGKTRTHIKARKRISSAAGSVVRTEFAHRPEREVKLLQTLSIAARLVMLLVLAGCSTTPAVSPTAAQPSATVALATDAAPPTVRPPSPAPPPTEQPSATRASSPAAATIDARSTAPPPAPAATLAPSPQSTATPMPRPTALPPSPAPPSPAIVRPTPTVSPQPSLTPTVPGIEIVVDNRDAGFSTAGHWFIGDGGLSYRGDCAWAPRGIGNIATVRPALPLGGSYEVFAWWCGDPNGDQADRAQIQIYPTAGRVATYPVHVNLQEGAGRWNSLGIYRLETNGFVSVDSGLGGNVVADAFRFVYRSAERIVITPTPAPTPITWTNHPPSPLEQLSAGDLSARLGLTRRFYAASPLVASEETTFDDCQAFPRDGCGGPRTGWRAQARHREVTVAYRVAKDYRHVAIEPPAGLAERQSLYLYGSKGSRFLRLDRYPDDTWMLSAAPLDAEAPATSMPLEPQVVRDLREFIDRYGTIRFTSSGGIRATLYGFGPKVELSEGDRGRLGAMIEALAQGAWYAIP